MKYDYIMKVSPKPASRLAAINCLGDGYYVIFDSNYGWRYCEYDCYKLGISDVNNLAMLHTDFNYKEFRFDIITEDELFLEML